MPGYKAGPNPEALCGRPKSKKAEKPGEPCGNRAGMRTEHLGVGACWLHGGNTKAANAAGRRELAEQEVQRQLERAKVTYGLHREIDPHSALREELFRTAGIVDWLEQEVQSLERDEVVHTVGEELELRDGRQVILVKDERANEWVKLYQAERKAFREIARDCISCGIQQRTIELAEEQAGMINTVLRATLVACGVDVTSPEVLAIVRKQLTEAARRPDDIDGVAHAA